MSADTTMNNEQEHTLDNTSLTEIRALFERVTYLEAVHEGVVAQITQLTARLENHALNTPSRVPATTPRIFEPKLADPEHFSGDRLKLLDFLTKCRLKFRGQPSRFPDEESKVIYTGALLEGVAFSWFQPFFAKATTTEQFPPEIATFEALAKSLTTLYGDPNLEITSEHSLRNLSQTQDVPGYIAQFERYAQYVKWNDSAKTDQFYEGLRSNVKDELVHQERPKNLADMKAAATRVDTRIRQRMIERAHNTADKKPTNLPPTSHFPSRSSSTYSLPLTPSRTPSPAIQNTPNTQRPSGIPSHTHDGTVPMSLNTTGPFPRIHREPLTDDEKQRRRDNHLCLYCADPAHTAINCHRAPKRSRSVNETRFSFDVGQSSAPSSEMATN